MKIGKYFRWDMGHRLIYHKEKCFNIHGHSYKAYIEIEGNLNEEGMVLDFSDLKQHVRPLIDSIDHSFMCYSKDNNVRKFLENNKFKIVIVDFETTAENIAKWLFIELKKTDLNIVRIKVWETESSVVEFCGGN